MVLANLGGTKRSGRAEPKSRGTPRRLQSLQSNNSKRKAKNSPLPKVKR